MGVARFVYTPFGAYKPEESSLDYPDKPKLAIGVAALTTTAAATFDEEPTVELDGMGNPTGNIIIVVTPDLPERDVERFGVEAAFKIKGFNAVAEYFTEELDPMGLPTTDTDGHYVQLAYLFPNKKLEVAARHAEVSPDVVLSKGVVPTSLDETETGLAVSYYFVKHKYKLQADFRELEFDEDPLDDVNEARLQLQIAF